jgi:hypothetical protein
VVVYLIYQILWQWLVISETRKQSHPIMKLSAAIYLTHPLIIIGNNINERSHDVRKEDDANHHDEDATDHLIH